MSAGRPGVTVTGGKARHRDRIRDIIEDNGSRWWYVRRSIDPIMAEEYISFIRTLALFDAHPEWDLLKTALNSDLRPRDGRAAAGALCAFL